MDTIHGVQPLFFYSIVAVIVAFNVLPLLVPRLVRHEHSYLQAALFFYYFCTEVSRPFFPLYSQSFHTGMTSSLQMALPQIVWGATALLFTPLGTYLGKHYGNRVMLVAASVLTSVSLFGMAYTHDYWVMLVSRGLMAACFGIVSILAVVHLSQWSTAKVMGVFLSALAGASVCASVVGGALSDKFTYHYVFELTLLISVIPILLLMFSSARTKVPHEPVGDEASFARHNDESFNTHYGPATGLRYVPEPPMSSSASNMEHLTPKTEPIHLNTKRSPSGLYEAPTVLKSITEPSPNVSFWLLIGQMRLFLFSMVVGAPYRLAMTGFVLYLMPVHLKDSGLTLTMIGQMLTVYHIVNWLTVAPIAQWVDKHERYVSGTVFSIVAMAGALVLFSSFLGTPWVLWLSVILLSVAMNVNTSVQIPMIPSTLAKECATFGQKNVVAYFKTMERVASVVGPLFCAALYYHYGANSPIYLGGLLLLIGLGAVVFFRIKKQVP